MDKAVLFFFGLTIILILSIVIIACAIVLLSFICVLIRIIRRFLRGDSSAEILEEELNIK